MEVDRVLEWDRWVKQRVQRGCSRERFRELEAVSFSILVDNLPECVSKKELFHLFSWSGMINDIYLVRRMKGEMIHLFAFIRYTTKIGASKAITKMNRTSLSGRRIFVGEARNRKDNKNPKIYESTRTVEGEDIEVVKGREFDLAADLVSLEYTEFENDGVKRHITKDVLNEWSFAGFNQSGCFYDSVFKDYSAELVTMNRNSDEEQVSITRLPYEILNEWNFEKKNKSDRGESESSGRTVTRSYGREECDENKLTTLEDESVESEDDMELSGSLKINESVCSSGVGIVEVMDGRSHDKKLDSERKEEEAKMPVMISKSDRRESRTTSIVVNCPSDSDSEEDFMSGLKELNEIQELKIREAKRKEKARKSRPKKLKI
ncbi:hypothetical protein PIB30_012166 [Stylosanthes scabra]|uniref:RRM domain-containing protein n=1 Tax=Stylosanthes scabra TaxID=79078 RepID=A0ABU6T6X4_9FABA|nr:hypothetical protein [Stylosanthes scabra]